MVVLLPARVNSLYQPHGGLVHAGLHALWMPALDYYPGIMAQTVPDRSGNGNTLTLGSTSGVDANDPTWSEQGLVGNGTSQYCTAGNVVGTSPVTFMAVTNAAAAQYQAILGAGGTAGDGFEWRLTGSNQQNLVRNGIVQIATSIGSNYSGLCCPAVTYDGTNYAFYRNGVPDSSGVSAHTVATITTYNVMASGSATGTVDFLNGTISALLIYHRVLSPGEIARNYRWLRSQLAPSGIALP